MVRRPCALHRQVFRLGWVLPRNRTKKSLLIHVAPKSWARRKPRRSGELDKGQNLANLKFLRMQSQDHGPREPEEPFFTQNPGWSTLQKKCKLVLKRTVMSSTQPEKAVPRLSSRTAGTSLLVRQYLPAYVNPFPSLICKASHFFLSI